ncbi:MAG TPA: serine/threonine-protein kinase, partial [Gemmatimonadales bacterium]|nr:serine/threonine-protein kinase [Gemmatimonadales bacterium]
MTAPAPGYLREGSVLAGRYTVGRELGRGGFSVVYLAQDAVLGVQVALKLLVPPPAAAALARERMRREVQAVRGLTHASIVAVHDFVDDGSWSFVVMEYVAGPDLSAQVRRSGPLGASDVVLLGRDIAAGLAMAHRHGVIHRDVKPQNILIGPDGRARLTDFGSARLDGVTGVTRTGGLVGTLDYQAPELLAGERGDGRADLYALGLTLHFALTGRLPDRPNSHVPVPASTEGHRPSRVAGVPRVPGWLDDLVARATAAAAARRFPSARAMEDALAAGGASGAVPGLAEPESRCALCGEADPFGLGLCVRCGGTSPHAADRAVLVTRPAGRAEGERVRQAVHELLGGRVDGSLADAAARGERVLLQVPPSSTGTVLEHLATRGIPARAVPASRAWTALPPGYYALVLTMAGAGLAAGAVMSSMLWAGPAVALCWWFMGFREIRRPALVSVGLATTLPPDAEREVVEALTEMRGGTARQLLADIVRTGQRLAGENGAVEAVDLGPVLVGASRAARQVEGLEESLLHLD